MAKKPTMDDIFDCWQGIIKKGEPCPSTVIASPEAATYWTIQEELDSVLNQYMGSAIKPSTISHIQKTMEKTLGSLGCIDVKVGLDPNDPNKLLVSLQPPIPNYTIKLVEPEEPIKYESYDRQLVFDFITNGKKR